MPLPSPLAFLSSLFHPTTGTTDRTLVSSSSTKPVLLTLHCLFPTELLPALDLLDRRLVTRFDAHPRAPRGGGEEQEEAGGVGDAICGENKEGGRAAAAAAAAVYYVRSSRRGRYSGTTTTAEAGMGTRGVVNYEVRLRAWNCTCPAFAFAAFGPRDNDEDVWRGRGNEDDEDDDGEGGEGGRMGDGFGGLGLGGREVPVCKHLLACLLVELGGGLGDFVNQRVVGREEIAGWAAGWGE